MNPEITYAIGDIHGCAAQLEKMLEAIAERAAGRPHQIITLGDYSDRGPDSRMVLEILMGRKDIIKLKGNHEEMMVEARRGGYSELNFWTRNGGDTTLRSFEAKVPAGVPTWYTDFIDDLPYFHEDDLRYFVHAGINPWIQDLAKQNDHDRVWIRHEFLNWPHPFPKYIVHGHTPLVGGDPDVRSNRANLDTCCFGTGILTCAAFDNAHPQPFEIIQTDGLGSAYMRTVER